MNTCIDLGYWPTYFKISLSIIISKPNKAAYDLLKTFRLVVLLNILGKLIKKLIGKRLQFQLIFNDFIHSNQFGDLKQWLTTDADIFLMCLISSRWIKKLQTSTLAFDIAQLFPSLNHQLLPKFLNKAGFNPRISGFFSDYLISKKTQYLWNSFTSSFFNVDVDIGQGSVLSPNPNGALSFPNFSYLSKMNKKSQYSSLSSLICGWWTYYFSRKIVWKN